MYIARIANTKGNYIMLMQGEKMVGISHIGVILLTAILMYVLMMIIVAKEKGEKMSDYSDYKCGAITEEEYNDYCRWEDDRDKAEEDEDDIH